MTLARYHAKRNFRATPEPRGRVARAAKQERVFVIQKHAASHLHYDFRLEWNGVLLSWAVPKGPSVDPAERRLAMHVEDHPLDYGNFEGSIPAGQYGGGTVMLWDRGTWTPQGDPAADIAKGQLKFHLHGKKLHGGWMLLRTAPGRYGGKGKEAWLLIKEKDEWARPGKGSSVVDTETESVLSHASMETLARNGDAAGAVAALPDGARRRAATSKRTATARRVPAGKRVSASIRVTTAKQPAAVKRAPAAKRGADASTAAAPTHGVPDVATLAGAAKGRLPATLSPMLATLVKEAPQGTDWLHEVKFDGYRLVSRVQDGRVQLYSRNGKDWTAALPSLASAVAKLPLQSGWLDGELAVVDERGRTQFQALQHALSEQDSAALVYFVFDVPFANGFDLRNVRLRERKRVLHALLEHAPPDLRESLVLDAPGKEMLAQACKLGLEGIISKRPDSAYQSTRGRDWIKVKCTQRQEMVIAGFTDPQRSRSGFGALLLGVYDANGALRYSGRVGTGFDNATLAKLLTRLKTLERKTPAFADPPTGAEARGVHWMRPELVAEVTFTEWTENGTLRHPSYLGLRVDKKARDVVREGAPSATVAVATRSNASKSAPARAIARKPEKPAMTASTVSATTATKIEGIALSNAAKLYFPEAKISKGDLAAYYAAIAPRMLPHVQRRPLSLVRCPDGWQGECFYQKHAPASLPTVVGRIEVEESAGKATYAGADKASALVALVQWGVIEMHPWNSRKPKLMQPDQLIFDFDPDDAVTWAQVVAAAKALRLLFDELGLHSFVKTTGGKGLHVVLPIRPTMDWDEAKAFCHAVAETLARSDPALYVTTMSKARRKGRIFIDYLRNALGATAVAPYSVRARKNAPVATPLAWDELGKTDLRFDHFNLRNLPARISAQKVDPWQAMPGIRQTVTLAMRKRVGST